MTQQVAGERESVRKDCDISHGTVEQVPDIGVKSIQESGWYVGGGVGYRYIHCASECR